MLLKLQNIGKIYNSNDMLVVGIRGINLDLDYNEFVTIEGESGSGKSTLLNVIGANDTYEEGELYFNGSETSHYSDTDWEKYREENIATVFQDFNIIENLTVLENVELALLRLDDPRKRRKIAKDLIAKVGLTKQMNQRGSKLSGGEKQRTVIARALAKDSPIILADEPTGNLDVKASREVAKLLKDVSKDKLVIVVTHNPEFFREYATRRVRVFDGKISEDEVIEKTCPVSEEAAHKVQPPKKRTHDLKNVFYLGTLNYRSRPKFTAMMSLALLVCAITLFIVMSVFGSTLIQPLTNNLDGVGTPGKVIVSDSFSNMTEDRLDEIAGQSNAGYIFLDKKLSEFTVQIPDDGVLLNAYEVICLYAPYEYSLAANEGVLVLPESAGRDAGRISDVFTKAGIGLDQIQVIKSVGVNDVRLYLGYDLLAEKGKRVQAINSTVKLGDEESRVYTFEVNGELEAGQINLVNSDYWNIVGKTAVFSINSEKAYTVVNDKQKNPDVPGIIVQMNGQDFNQMFRRTESVRQACMYFADDEIAAATVRDQMPEGVMGLLSTRRIYVQNAGDVYTSNILWYVALIAISAMFGVLISIIFMRSVKIFQADFAVYRTLGIPSKVSLRSLYVQMLLIFLPTLLLLPAISFGAAVIPGSTLPFISFGNFLFIELMLLMIVELVAFGFNKSLNGQSIRKSLKRGSKS